jgi:hypothetical protein
MIICEGASKRYQPSHRTVAGQFKFLNFSKCIWILNSHSSDYEEYSLVRYGAV